jgi:hypothetical protein
MSARDKYSAYCYRAAKQGFIALSFNAWYFCYKAKIEL